MRYSIMPGERARDERDDGLDTGDHRFTGSLE
jgi:hypothetical protein